MNISTSVNWIVLAVGLGPVVPFAKAQDSFGSNPVPRAQTQTQPAQAPMAPAQPSMQNGNRRPSMPAPAGNELQDLGVAPTDRLKAEPLHAATPTAIPGGRTITTADLVRLMRDPKSGALVFDVLGATQSLPNAFYATPAAQPGDFNDQVQRDFGNFLQQTTQGKLDRPMVFYCRNDHCWMSYNAALRAIKLGYRQIYWYRGGIEAWQQAGGPLVARNQTAPSRQP